MYIHTALSLRHMTVEAPVIFAERTLATQQAGASWDLLHEVLSRNAMTRVYQESKNLSHGMSVH